jgi:LuxR family maltose regulon positive regulatory protein
MLQTFVRAKLQRQRVNHVLVARPVLIQRVAEGGAGDVTLLVAPAGYGKTTVVTEWALQAKTPVAWYSIDESDNNFHQFLSYFVAAIQTIYPDSCKSLRGILERLPLPDVPRLADLLGQAIDELPFAFALVLDDYHCISDPHVENLLNELLRYPSRNMHLVITSRSLPALALARLRSNCRLNELSLRELCFTKAEAAALLHLVCEHAYTDATAAALHQRTEGWAAGLYLLALALGTAQHPADILGKDPSKLERYTAEYLMEQVLQQQPPRVRDFLFRTSIVERLAPGLAEAIMGNEWTSTGLTLRGFAQAGLFLHALDDTDEWHTYHPLFRSLLQQQLQASMGPKEIAVLHRRASTWLCRHGLYDDALQQAFAAGDTMLALQIVIDHFTGWLGRDPWHTIQRRLNLFPAELLDRHPWLLMARGHVFLLQSKWDAVLPLLTRAEERLADGDFVLSPQQERLLRGYLDVVWAVHWSAATDAEQATTAARRALAVLPDQDYYARGVLQLILTLALNVRGERALAEQMLMAALAQAELSPMGGAAHLRPLLCLCSLYFVEGSIELAAQVARMLLQKATEVGSLFDQLMAHLALGVAAYETNDLNAAVEHFQRGAELRYAGNVRGGHECLVGMALSYHALNRPEAVKATLLQLNDYHTDVASSVLAAEAISLQRRMGLAGTGAGNGDLRRRSVPARTGIWYGWLEIPAITEIRLALASGNERGIAQAESALGQLWSTAVELNKPVYQAALLALKALLLQHKRQRAAALETLRHALALAEEHGFVRSLADGGPLLEPLLAELAITEPSAIIAQVRAAIGAGGHKGTGSREPMAAMARLAIPLTRREREVLALLGQYRTDREIAETLVISPLTVRTHIENLSSKLSVNGRRAIVNQAREKGLLA